MRKFTREQANEIYNVLQNVCGASKGKYERDGFISTCLGGISEYRFQGLLGFGGKFYASGRVNFYPEDWTPERSEIRAEANSILQLILK